MTESKNVLNRVSREVKKLKRQLTRDKTTFVSPETIFFAAELSVSIQADKIKAKQIKEDLKNKLPWPFPNIEKIV